MAKLTHQSLFSIMQGFINIFSCLTSLFTAKHTNSVFLQNHQNRYNKVSLTHTIVSCLLKGDLSNSVSSRNLMNSHHWHKA